MSELDLYARYLDMGARLNKSGDDLAAWVEDKMGRVVSSVHTGGFILFDLFRNCSPGRDKDFVAYVKDRSPSDMVSLKAVASAYIDARLNKSFSKKPSASFSAKAESEPYRPSVRAYDKGNSRSNCPRTQRAVCRGNYPSQGHRSPSSQGYSGSGRSGASRSPSRDKNRSSFNSGQQFRPNSSGGSGVAASRNDVTCYQRGGKGHVRRECPSRPKEANSAFSVPKLPSHCCAAESGCDCRGIETFGNNESSTSDTPTHFDVLAPFSDLPVRQREDPSLAPWFQSVGLPTVAGVPFQIKDGVLKRLHAKSEFATVQTTIAVPESLRQLVLSYAHESDLADYADCWRMTALVYEFMFLL
ncbi:hypothetical protein PoB_005083800 [Plakobranchus ocellatus]|uniref:Uncharacterized protein n=1 Tax=Plakobranchus ocellatus TaxID=259542 RepID=A0AAV4BYN8_9GAST|nr:hypothetical protein PoB_005083800 [Plakobranchus ocellatus]